MIHAAILQPNVVIGQQPYVVSGTSKIQLMAEDEKKAFATRLNKVADLLNIPPIGKNRQTAFGKKFGVSQEAARKWLSGESLPQLAKCIEIAKEAKVGFEWLMTGRGAAPYDNTPEAKVYLAMQNMDESTKYQIVKISDSLAEPATGTDGPGTTKQ